MSKGSYFTPGKLFLAGEYFVVNGDADAILLPIKRGIYIDIKENKDYLLELSNRKENYVFDPIKMSEDFPNNYVRNAVQTAYKYLSEQKITTYPIWIKLHSTLESEDHISYGFGSSGAVVVGLIKAITNYYGSNLSKLALYKLSVLAVRDLLHQTSFADIALSAYGESILYRVFDKNWFDLSKVDSFTSMITREWPGLEISHFPFQLPPYLLINTNKKEDSRKLVSSFHQVVPSNVYQDRLGVYTKLMKSFYMSKDTSLLTKMQDIYEKLDQDYPFGYWVEEYDFIQKQSVRCSGHMKVSGAGGGDNVWIFFPNEEEKHACIDNFVRNGFTIFEDVVL